MPFVPSHSARCSLREKQSQWSEVRSPGQNVETSPPRFRVFLKVRDTVGLLGCRSLRPLPQASTQPPSYFPILRAKQAGGELEGCVSVWDSHTAQDTHQACEGESFDKKDVLPHTLSRLLPSSPEATQAHRASLKSTLLRTQTLD